MELILNVFGPNWKKRTFAPKKILENNDLLTKIKRKIGLFQSSITKKKYWRIIDGS